jgi:hypothetical protein
MGLAATLQMLFNGRVAGISGILAPCLDVKGSDRDWSPAFTAGLILGPLTAALVGVPIPSPQMPHSWALVVVARVPARIRFSSAILRSTSA